MTLSIFQFYDRKMDNAHVCCKKERERERMDGLPYTIHGISMKWRQYRWCQNIALCYDVLREMKPSSHVPLYEDETVGDCVLIKLQSYFSMAPSDCVWLWTQWLFIAAIEFELFFLLLCIILLYCFALFYWVVYNMKQYPPPMVLCNPIIIELILSQGKNVLHSYQIWSHSWCFM